MGRQLLTVKKNVNIVFVGKSGAGKSVLKNNILEIEEDLQICASHITDHYSTVMVEKHGVTITITDTVGLEGGKEQCKRSLKQMSSYVNEHGTIDLLMYCLPVGPSSKFNDQLVIMESLHEAFGEDIWKNCIVVFTFSNLILDRIRKKKGVSSEATALYEDHIKDYASKFEDKLTQLKVRNIQVRLCLTSHSKHHNQQTSPPSWPSLLETSQRTRYCLEYSSLRPQNQPARQEHLK